MTYGLFGLPLAFLEVAQPRRRERPARVQRSHELPVVDADDGLGTGKADYGIGGSVFKAAGRTSVFADVLFWKYGAPEAVSPRRSMPA